ncbi:MAG: hypothetical protein L6V95_07635 [Candidatus Melainabacteria bacterium]|nr:MAG: hypothetical protein L6V95_07635 [Candidatus Melainabacteria bacterium]
MYRMSHPLGEFVIEQALNADTPNAKIVFDITNYSKKLSIIEKLKGKSGYLVLNKLSIKSFEEADYLLFNAFCTDETQLDQETCEKLFKLSATSVSNIEIPINIDKQLDSDSQRHIASTITQNENLNNGYLKEEINRLNKWADDLIGNLDKEIADEKRKMRAYIKASEQETETNAEYIELQEKAEACRKKVSRLRREIDEKEEVILEKKNNNIKKLKRTNESRNKSKNII